MDLNSSEPRHNEERGRKDIGFAETRKGKSQVQNRKPGDGRTARLDVTRTRQPRSSADGVSQDKIRQTPKGSERSDGVTSRSSSHGYQSSVSTASRRTSRQRSSLSRTSTVSQQASRPRLIHSATSFHKTPSIYNKVRPAMSCRTSSAPTTHYPAKDPFTVHYNSCRLFQPPGAIQPTYQPLSAASSTEDLTSSSSPLSRQGLQSQHNNIPSRSERLRDPTNVTHDSAHNLTPIKHTPATIIDWTSPSTRRLEYEKIDKSNRGFRGWWRRVAPRWCSHSSRTGFYDERNDNDAGSIRRYRVDLPDDEGEDDGDNKDTEKTTTTSVTITETETNPSRGRSKREPSSSSWSCFNFHDR
ncbi:hypothetical protein MMC16_007608 [Acarospora aff. strigata]|nr:hypothetical protein [Acarospora aff. strigata]